MPTAGAFAGRLGEVAVSNAAYSGVPTGATFVEVEKANSPRTPGSLDTAESSNNDSGGSKEYLPTWDSGTLTFELIADENATGQEHLWTAYLQKETRAFRVRPRGNASGERQMFFLGIVTNIEYGGDKGDVAKYNVTVQRTGAITRNTQ